MIECPECHCEEARKIVKNGHVYRKKAPGVAIDAKRGAKVKRYLCTDCGYTARGSIFGLPETKEEEEEYLKNKVYTIAVPPEKKPIKDLLTKEEEDQRSRAYNDVSGRD
jgi:hypothetical protein